MRTVTAVHLIKVTLHALQNLSITAPETVGIKDVDLPVARDPLHGEAYVPTTGVIGSLRDHAGRSGMEPTDLIRIFGGRAAPDEHAASEGDPSVLTPSLIRAMGTRMRGAGETHVRVTTAIDRFRATAVDGSLRSRESIPAGAHVELFLSMAGPTPQDLSLVTSMLGCWQPVLGGGRGVGLGEAEVKSIQHHRFDLTDERGLAEWLDVGGPETWQCAGWDAWPIQPRRRANTIEIPFHLASDLMVATGDRVKVNGNWVATTMKDAVGQPYIPGSSLRGLFRSRAEFVLRTLGVRACASTRRGASQATDGEGDGLESACVSDPCAICAIFGYAGSRGHLRFSDAQITGPGTATRTHVAIDRFTGGQAHGLLYNQEVVPSGEFTVHITMEPGGDLEVARGLLAVVALDINAGLVGIGHGTARGMGDARLPADRIEELRNAWDHARSQIAPGADMALSGGNA